MISNLGTSPVERELPIQDTTFRLDVNERTSACDGLLESFIFDFSLQMCSIWVPR
jgi:hypothetical protein